MRHGRRRLWRLGVVLVGAVVAACGGSGGTSPAGSVSGTPAASAVTGSQTGSPVTADGDLCALLGPGDFAAVGIAGAGTPTKNSDDPSNAYCVYAGQSAGTGGVELDVFLDADGTGSEDTFATIAEAMNDADADRTKSDLGDVDAAAFDSATEGTFAAIAVWKGKLVFTIGAPTSDGARDQLVALARLVLERGAGLT